MSKLFDRITSKGGNSNSNNSTDSEMTSVLPYPQQSKSDLDKNRITDSYTFSKDNPMKKELEVPNNLQVTGTTRIVYMFIYIKAVTDIDCKNQEFHIQYHQYLQWAPTIEEYQSFKNDPSGYRPEFFPRLLPTNAKQIDVDVEETRHGDNNSLHLLTKESVDVWGEKVQYKCPPNGDGNNFCFFAISRKVHATISSPFILHTFPFDCQSLHVFFESLSTIKNVRLMPSIVKDYTMVLETGCMASAPEYNLHLPVIEFNTFASDESEIDDSYACCTVTVKLTRRYHAFCMRIIIPCGMISAISLSIFFLESDNLVDRLNMLVTLTLAMTAFLYVASDAIPAVPYMTLADKYIFFAFLALLVEILYICIGYANEIDDIHDTIAGIVFISWWGLLQLFVHIILIMAGASWYYSFQSKRLLSMSFSELSDAGYLLEEADSLHVSLSDAKVLYPF